MVRGGEEGIPLLVEAKSCFSSACREDVSRAETGFGSFRDSRAVEDLAPVVIGIGRVVEECV